MPKLLRCLQLFDRQTLAEREWVIVTDKSNAQVFKWVSALARENIRAVPMPDGSQRWQLRNAAIDNATGKLLAQWDDDDLFHPELLWSQTGFLKMTGADTCFLQTHLHVFEGENRVWVLDWGRISDKGHPGTAVWRAALGQRYKAGFDTSEAHWPEDSVFQADLVDRGSVAYLADMPYLYGYTFHGRNTTGEPHHRKLIRDLAMTSDQVKVYEAEIKERFDGLHVGHATLMGIDGRVCDLWGTENSTKTT
jgi:glycosyltransferase involved in cell wall biosynthesis